MSHFPLISVKFAQKSYHDSIVYLFIFIFTIFRGKWHTFIYFRPFEYITGVCLALYVKICCILKQPKISESAEFNNNCRLVDINAEPHSNTLYKHFYYFVTEHNLISKKELNALKDLTERLIGDQSKK